MAAYMSHNIQSITDSISDKVIKDLIQRGRDKIKYNLDSNMKLTEKLEKAIELCRPHINGHRTALELFQEVLDELRRIEEASTNTLPTKPVEKAKWTV